MGFLGTWSTNGGFSTSSTSKSFQESILSKCVSLYIRNPIPIFRAQIYSWHCLSNHSHVGLYTSKNSIQFPYCLISPDLQPRLFGHRFLGTSIRPSWFKFLTIPMFELLINIPIIPRYVGFIIYVYIYIYTYIPQISLLMLRNASQTLSYIYIIMYNSYVKLPEGNKDS